MNLRYYGDPILRKWCEPIGKITQEIRDLAHEMIDFMRRPEHPGIGLAAPQVGHVIRLFVVAIDHYEEDGSVVYSAPYAYINPELFDPSEETGFMDEGCLSIPGFRIAVERPHSITIRALNLDGEEVEERFHDLAARCRMHETDHLNGVLMQDRASKTDREAAKPILHEIKKRYSC